MNRREGPDGDMSSALSFFSSYHMAAALELATHEPVWNLVVDFDRGIRVLCPEVDRRLHLSVGIGLVVLVVAVGVSRRPPLRATSDCWRWGSSICGIRRHCV